MSRRDVTHAIQTTVWYDQVALCKQTSQPNALARFFEPESFVNRTLEDGYRQIYHRNKWRHYKSGRHRPHSTLALLVENGVPGSQRTLTHPLWTILRLWQDADRKSPEWAHSLAAQLGLFRRPWGDVARRHNHHPGLDSRLLTWCEQNASLDALAFLTALFMRETRWGVSTGMTERVARSLFRTLLVLCHRPPIRRSSEALFHIYKTRLFPRAVIEDWVYDLDSFDFQKALALMDYYLLCEPPDGWYEPSETKRAASLLAGRWGFDGLVAFAPRRRPIKLLDGSEELRQHRIRDLRWVIEFVAGDRLKIPIQLLPFRLPDAADDCALPAC